MTILTVTAKGQVTLRKDLLEHLGVGPGDRISANPLPDGRLEIAAAPGKETLRDFIGCLKGAYDGPSRSLEEMDEAIASGWAGER